MSIFDTVIPWDDLPDAPENPYEWDAMGELKAHSQIADANTLYDSMMLTRKGTAWKPSVQALRWNELHRIAKAQRELDALERGLPGAYEPQDGPEFLANERGNIRPIAGMIVDDRMVSHALNDTVLVPSIRPHLIYDNGASLKGKGVDFARKRLACHLTRYFSREGTNEGFIRLKDQTKYYDNIIHDTAYSMVCFFTTDTLARKLAQVFLKHAELDVSDLSDELFSLAQRVKFDRVKWRMGNHPKDGKKFLRKGVGVGDQLSQTIGIFYPWRVDNEAKIIQGSLYYARYMDDSYDIDRSLERLKYRAAAIDRVADGLQLFTNTRKTCIARIDRGFVYLQHKYRLLPDGTVEIKILHKSLTRFRRRLKSLRRFLDSGKITTADVVQVARSWIYARRDVLTYLQLRRLELLILELFGREAYDQVYDHDEKWKCH